MVVNEKISLYILGKLKKLIHENMRENNMIEEKTQLKCSNN
jgi:hypothetical protein